jgi:hypothetical protein
MVYEHETQLIPDLDHEKDTFIVLRETKSSMGSLQYTRLPKSNKSAMIP